jgi:hypothetical protein
VPHLRRPDRRGHVQRPRTPPGRSSPTSTASASWPAASRPSSDVARKATGRRRCRPSRRQSPPVHGQTAKPHR